MVNNYVSVFKNATKDFCLNTGLHGYKYFVGKDKNKSERTFWFLLIITSHIAALIVSLLAYASFKEISTITVTDSTHYPVWNYPFPAVTLCNLNQISKEKAYDLAKKLFNKQDHMTVDELAREFRLLYQLINQNNHYKNIERNLSRLQGILDKNNLRAHDVLQSLSPGCGHFDRCLWKSEERRCGALIEEIATPNGFCCTFNYFGIKNHTFKGLNPNRVAERPRRVSACGFNTGLEFLVANDLDNYFATDIMTEGFKVYIHHPYEFPDWSIPFIFLPKQFVLFLSITPVLTYASNNVRLMDVNIRNCLFFNERKLLTFENYTYHNCMTECRMNITLELCACLPFYYFNENAPFRQRTKICTLKDVSCLKRIKNIIIRSTSGFNLNSINAAGLLRDTKGMCNCLPTCEFVTYPYEGSAGNLLNKYVNSDINLFVGINIGNHSVYRVAYSDLTSTRNRCDIYYNWDVLLALFGGILGLFIGFSFVSGFELIYYFTIRPVIEYILQMKKQRIKRKIVSINWK